MLAHAGTVTAAAAAAVAVATATAATAAAAAAPRCCFLSFIIGGCQVYDSGKVQEGTTHDDHKCVPCTEYARVVTTLLL